MFAPGYASVAALVGEDETLAKKAGVQVGDYIVAVNGEGFRRFPPDFKEEELKDVTEGVDLINFADDNVHNDAAAETEENEIDKVKKQHLKDRVMTSKKPGDTYDALLGKIRAVKSSSTPLLVSMERYSYDSRVHSWSRFLSARNGNVPSAMTMIQAHERWRSEYFPIDLTSEGLQRVLKAHAVSEIDVRHESEEDVSACVYIDFAKLQSLRSVDIEENEELADDVIKAFVVYTETLLAKSADPRRPKSSQFVDLTGVSLKQGVYVKLLKKLYGTFEGNYPECVSLPTIFRYIVAIMCSLFFETQNSWTK